MVTDRFPSNGASKSNADKSGPDERKTNAAGSGSLTPNSRVNGNDSAKSLSRMSDPAAPQPPSSRESTKRMSTGPNLTSANSTPMPHRPDSRGGYQSQHGSRLAHNLPTRPDAQPLRPRPNERLGDRPAEYAPAHARYEARTNGPNEFGRLERIGGAPQDRPVSPGRHSRSQERLAGSTDRPEWPSREAREYDERSMRGPPRDARGPPLRNAPYGDDPRDHRDHRESRDQRDYRERDPMRERTDSRGPPPLAHTSGDSRSRHHTGPGMAPVDLPSHRRDTFGQHSDRGALPPRPPANADPSSDRVNINPQRAAMIEENVNPDRAAFMKDDRVSERGTFMPEDRGRNPTRIDRDSRDPRPPYMKDGPRHSRDARSAFDEGERLARDPRSTFTEEVDRHARDPRDSFMKEERARLERDPRPDERDMRRDRDERASAAYYGNDSRRDYRDERSMPQPYPNARDRREDMSGTAPTGPRGGRDSSSHVSRDMFQPSHSSRPVAPSQDPNYGRLNQPSESIPSGPKCKSSSSGNETHSLTRQDPSSDRRDVQAQPSAPAPSSASATGVHPSRMENFRGPPSQAGPPLQTNVSNAPSGPRASGRTPLPSPSSRGPPTGPAFVDRNLRRQDSRTQLGAINNVLSQTQGQSTPSTPPERTAERSHRRRERSRSGERSKTDDRPREKREGSKRDRERESSHRERSDRRDERRKDDRERDRTEKKRSRDPMDQPHGEAKRSRR